MNDRIGCAILVIAIVAAVVRSITIKEYERQHPPLPSASSPSQQLTQTGVSVAPHNEFKPTNANTNTNTFQPTVNVSVPVNQVSHQRVGHREPNAPSVFEATDNTRIVTYGFDGQTGHLIREPYYGREEDLPDHITIVNAALAQFHYRHDAGVEPSLHVSAHLFAHDSDRKPLKPLLYHTVWDNQDLDRQITFSAGKVHDLIVALFRRVNPEGIVLYEYATETLSHDFGTDVLVRPKLHDVKGTDFFIKIELTPKRWNDPLPKQTFWFRLTLEPEPEFVRIGAPAPAGVRFR